MFIFPGRAPAVAGNMSSGRNYNLTDQDYHDILSEAPHVRAAAPVMSRHGHLARSATYGNTNGEVSGVPPNYDVDPLSAAGRRPLDQSGRRIAEAAGRGARRRDAEESRSPARPAVGTTILLNGIRFEVIGVVQRVGHGDDNSTNNRVFLPFSTMRQFFPLTKDEAGERGLVHQLSAARSPGTCAGARGSAQDHRPQSWLRLA